MKRLEFGTWIVEIFLIALSIDILVEPNVGVLIVPTDVTKMLPIVLKDLSRCGHSNIFDHCLLVSQGNFQAC